MIDETETIRREMLTNGQVDRDLAKAQDTWTTDEVRELYDVIGFMAPFVVVRRKADGVKGSLMFKHSPRVYFNFVVAD